MTIQPLTRSLLRLFLLTITCLGLGLAAATSASAAPGGWEIGGEVGGNPGPTKPTPGGGGTVVITNPPPANQVSGTIYWPEGIIGDASASCSFASMDRRPLGYSYTYLWEENAADKKSDFEYSCLYAPLPATSQVTCAWDGTINAVGPEGNAQQPRVTSREYAGQTYAAGFQGTRTIDECLKRLRFDDRIDLTAYGYYRLTATPRAVVCTFTDYTDQTDTITNCGQPFVRNRVVKDVTIFCGRPGGVEGRVSANFSDQGCITNVGAPARCATIEPVVDGGHTYRGKHMSGDTPLSRAYANTFMGEVGVPMNIEVAPATLTGDIRNQRGWTPQAWTVDKTRGYFSKDHGSDYSIRGIGQPFDVEPGYAKSNGAAYDNMDGKPVLVQVGQSVTADVLTSRLVITGFGVDGITTRTEDHWVPVTVNCSTDVPIGWTFIRTIN